MDVYRWIVMKGFLPIKVLSQLMPPIAYPNDPPKPAMMVNVLSPSA